MSGTGTTTIPASAAMNLNSTSSKILLVRTLNNAGTTTWNDGYFYLGEAAVFNNQTGATFDAKAPSSRRIDHWSGV